MLFVDLWQSPILGFTHYETCLMNKLKVHTTDIKDSDITVKQNNNNIDVDVELMRTIGVTDSISIDIDLSFSTDLNSSK